METKTVKKSRRKYDADFKKEVIKMIEMGRSVPDVAMSLSVGANLIYRWINQAKTDSVPFSDRHTETFFDKEKASLQTRIKELEMERDILKKALGIFSR